MPENEYKKESTKDFFQAFANLCSQVAGSRWAFLTAVFLIVLWAATGPIFRYSDAWQLVVNTATTIITFLMVFLIQNAQNRDSHALHLKSDEIIRAERSANNRMIDIEKLSDKDPFGDRVREDSQGMRQLSGFSSISRPCDCLKFAAR